MLENKVRLNLPIPCHMTTGKYSIVSLLAEGSALIIAKDNTKSQSLLIIMISKCWKKIKVWDECKK